MAVFSPQKFNLSDINGGQRFEDGQIPEEIVFNAPIEGSAYAINKSEEAITTSQEAYAKATEALDYVFGDKDEIYKPLSAHPVGSIYMSLSTTSPASIFRGGDWEKIEGKFLVGAGNLYSLGTTGGSADAVVVSHHHTGLYYNAISQDRELSADTANGQQVSSGGNITRSSDIQGTNRYVTGEVGVDGTGKNIPPYLAVNIWKRIG